MDDAHKEVMRTADLDPLSIFATVSLGAYFSAVRCPGLLRISFYRKWIATVNSKTLENISNCWESWDFCQGVDPGLVICSLDGFCRSVASFSANADQWNGGVLEV